MLKIDVACKNTVKSWEKVFPFSDKSIWSGSCKFSLLWRVYSSSAVNLLRIEHNAN